MPVSRGIKSNKYKEIELEKVLDAILALHTLRVQLGSIFGTLILAVSGFALSSQKVGVLFMSAAILWVFIYMDRVVRITAGYYYLRCVQLQRTLAKNDPDAFLGTFYTIRSKAQARIRQLADMSDISKRNDAIGSIMGIRYGSYVGFWIPLIASLVQIAVGLFLWLDRGWLLF